MLNDYTIDNFGSLDGRKDLGRQIKISSLQENICGSIDYLDKLLKERYQNELERKLQFMEQEQIAGYMGKFNEYYPMPEL